jgi:hypothetical protein
VETRSIPPATPARSVSSSASARRGRPRSEIDRGQLPADTDTEVALDLLYGAAYHRLLNGHQPLNGTFARNVVEVIVNGLGGDRLT